jgi:GGDEF domain-containing protein
MQSNYEVEILAFAELIKSTTRPEDLCARLGMYEFTMIVKAQLDIGRMLAHRVSERWSSEFFTCKSALLEAKKGESSLEILNRLDNQELLPHSPS